MSLYESSYQELKEKGSKTYQIELTCAELEFIKDVLIGINDFENRLNGYQDDPRNMFVRGFEQIYPDELADKIFEQCVDDDGEYR